MLLHIISPSKTLGTLFLLLFSIFSHGHAAIQKDEVTAIPGWTGALPSKTYTGHIGIANNTRFLNYMFFESQTTDPKTAPVVLWMQGGPGASGFLGLFTEMGPFQLNQNSWSKTNDLPQLLANPHTWNKEANYLFFESPSGVGYSYCIDKCPEYDDVLAAKDNYEFVVNFFEAFSEFKNNDFYISGESYAGIYIPTLVNEILTNQNKINLKGVLVGNGCTGIETNGGCSKIRKWITFDFLHGHGQISTQTYQKAKKLCDGTEFDSPICHELEIQLNKEAGPFNINHVYDECTALELLSMQYETYDYDSALYKQYHGHDYPCFQIYTLTKWANHPSVQEFFKTPYTDWNYVSYRIQYTRTEIDVFPYYQKMMENNIKILIYFGDIDANVPYNGGEQWITNLGLKQTQEWRPWSIDGNYKTAGYIMKFEDKMTYLTVRGAGHLVPQMRPVQAYHMFKNFVFDLPFPHYYPHAEPDFIKKNGFY